MSENERVEIRKTKYALDYFTGLMLTNPSEVSEEARQCVLLRARLDELEKRKGSK